MENDTQDFIESHCLMTSMDKYNSKGQKMTHKDRKWPTRIEVTHKDRKWPTRIESDQQVQEISMPFCESFIKQRLQALYCENLLVNHIIFTSYAS